MCAQAKPTITGSHVPNITISILSLNHLNEGYNKLFRLRLRASACYLSEAIIFLTFSLMALAQCRDFAPEARSLLVVVSCNHQTNSSQFILNNIEIKGETKTGFTLRAISGPTQFEEETLDMRPFYKLRLWASRRRCYGNMLHMKLKADQRFLCV